jgi:hypothetical protein
MSVPRGRHSGIDFDDRLNDLASWDAEIVPLEIDAPGPSLLRPRPEKSQAARGYEGRDHCHSPRLHVNLVPIHAIRDEHIRELRSSTA